MGPVWIGALAVLAVLALSTGAVLLAGRRARLALRADHPPPGRLVDVGGLRMHLCCQGEGGPTVVMDAGQGEFSVSWARIQEEVSRHTRVCAYDRAGMGWSDPRPGPRTNARMVAELRLLLQQAGVPGPYVLVGASLGGLNARLYAHLYPQEVAGLVLVDASHEEQYTSDGMRQAFEGILAMAPRMYGLMGLLVRLGLPALLPGRFAAFAPGSESLPDPAGRANLALRLANPGYFAAAQAELAAIQESHAEVRSMQITSLGDIPLVVLMHGKREAMQTPELTELNEATNRRLQPLVAGQSSRGRLIVAEESGHAIAYEQPELVVQAILEAVEAARTRMEASPAPRAATE